MGRGSRWNVGRDSVAILAWPTSKWRYLDRPNIMNGSTWWTFPRDQILDRERARTEPSPRLSGRAEVQSMFKVEKSWNDAERFCTARSLCQRFTLAIKTENCIWRIWRLLFCYRFLADNWRRQIDVRYRRNKNLPCRNINERSSRVEENLSEAFFLLRKARLNALFFDISCQVSSRSCCFLTVE